MRKISLLGASGSIGQSTLRVLREHKDEYQLVAAAALKNVDTMLSIAREFSPKYLALADENAALELKHRIHELNLKCEVLAGQSGVDSCASLDEIDTAVCAVVGAAGLSPALAAARSGKILALANKEALVMSGKLFFDEVRAHNAKVYPVDSEHSAIFQSLPEQCQVRMGYCNLAEAGVHKILLTGSGGPFREIPLTDLEHVTAKEAVAHPVWNMGPKISVDSSTMMNKGLEFIEARYLFNAKDSDIEVVIHPQSVVHSMVAYIDGAVMAQMGNPDMCTPIARALAYPKRITSTVAPLNFFTLKALTFMEPDFKRYPCLKLAMQASFEGQGATTALNAANEVAVAAFLDSKIGYLDIARLVDKVLNKMDFGNIYSLEEILDTDRKTRQICQEEILKIS